MEPEKRMKLDYAVLADDSTVDVERWNLRVTVHTSVGRCWCDGPMTPGPPEKAGSRVYLPMTCDRCAYSPVLLAGRPVRRDNNVRSG